MWGPNEKIFRSFITFTQTSLLSFVFPAFVRLFVSFSHLLPLVDVADEPGQAEQPKQAQDFGESDDAQRPRCPVDFRVQTVNHKEDVVHWNG